MSPASRPRGRHRAPERRGWAPRAVLGALTAPLGVVGGVGLAVASAALDRPGLAVVGVALAGAPAVYHAARSAVLSSQVDAVSAARREALTELVTVRRQLEDLRRAVAQRPVVEEPVVEAPVIEAPQSTGAFGLVDARIDTGELQRIWDLDPAVDAGRLPVTVAEPRVLVGFVGAAPAVARRRAGTTDDRVFDAILHAEADLVTRALELPARRGRHAAPLPADAPAGPGRDLADARTDGLGAGRPRLEVVRSTRRGRHVA
ncbi:MAG: hypothetical protein ACLGIV_07765 [Actinomycetes bacterium]